MKNLFLLSLFAFGCGYSQIDNETVAYVKHVTNQTPILCSNYTNAELDMRTPGTMTSEKVSFTVLNKSDADLLRKANESGVKVKITSNEARFVWCGNFDLITKVEVLSQ